MIKSIEDLEVTFTGSFALVAIMCILFFFLLAVTYVGTVIIKKIKRYLYEDSPPTTISIEQDADRVFEGSKCPSCNIRLNASRLIDYGDGKHVVYQCEDCKSVTLWEIKPPQLELIVNEKV